MICSNNSHHTTIDHYLFILFFFGFSFGFVQNAAAQDSFPSKSGTLIFEADKGYGIAIELSEVVDTNLSKVSVPIGNTATCFWDVFVEADTQQKGHQSSACTSLGRVPSATREVHTIAEALLNGGKFLTSEDGSFTATIDVSKSDISILSFYALGNPISFSDVKDTERCNAVALEQLADFLLVRVISPGLGYLIDENKAKAVPKVAERIAVRFGTNLLSIVEAWRAGSTVDFVKPLIEAALAIVEDKEIQNLLLNELGWNSVSKKAFKTALFANEVGTDTANLVRDATYLMLRAKVTPCPVLLTIKKKSGKKNLCISTEPYEIPDSNPVSAINVIMSGCAKYCAIPNGKNTTCWSWYASGKPSDVMNVNSREKSKASSDYYSCHYLESGVVCSASKERTQYKKW